MTNLRALAERGAVVRLAQLDDERRAILDLFPGLKTTESGAPIARGRTSKRKRTMTAEQRLAVSKRMRAYWANRRKARA